MAFAVYGCLGEQSGAPVLRSEILTNSITVTEHDAVRLASGFIALGTAGTSVYGHVVGIRTDKGVGLETDGSTGAETGSFVGTFTAASNNQTVGKVRAEVDVSKNTIYSAEADAALGTTTGSNLAGFFMDLVDEDTLDESTAATTAAQYATHGSNPEDTTKALVNIFESQIFGPLAA